MPEGPSIVILKEAAQKFKGRKVLEVSGNTSIDKSRMLNKTIIDFNSWGKHFLICFERFTVRVHLMLFGSYRIDERREAKPRLALKFSNGELNFYTVSVQYIDEPLDTVYDWNADVMSDAWNPKLARKKLLAQPQLMVCDALLNQHLFSGVGNIIKNEILFRIRVHPKSIAAKLPPKQLSGLIRESRTYSFEFLAWKKAFTLKKHWLAYHRKICPRCEIPLINQKLGKTQRRTFFCKNCQILYN
jgi:endonuclease-8